MRSHADTAPSCGPASGLDSGTWGCEKDSGKGDRRPAATPEGIFRLRRAIDRIDERILALINARLALARRIGEEKGRQAMAVVDRRREAQVIQRLMAANTGPLADEALAGIFGRIMAEARRVQAGPCKEKGAP